MQSSQTLSSLTKQQKEATALLSIGTFLEFFDLMLYVHMAVLLNDLFFPKTSQHTESILAAFAFCSTFVFRPIGALILGWIGDSIGRKSTVIITTLLMAIACLIMANLPTYAQIGVTASWIMIVCRICQGFASMGEIVGAEVYITEAIRPPAQYPIVTIIAIFSILGGTAALGVGTLVTSYELNWRIAFWAGAIVAIIGTVARTTLRETLDFAEAKARVKTALEKAEAGAESLENIPIYKEKLNKQTMMALFFIQCGWPICFYFSYIHIGNIFKSTFGYTPEQVIHQNFISSIANLVGYIVIAILSYKIHPLKILKAKLAIYTIFILSSPFLLNSISSPSHLALIQAFSMFFILSTNPAMSVMYTHIPIFRRFTYAAIIFAVSRALMAVITSFGLIYLTESLGHWGLLVIMVPLCIGFSFGLNRFAKLEIEAGRYYQKKNMGIAEA